MRDPDQSPASENFFNAFPSPVRRQAPQLRIDPNQQRKTAIVESAELTQVLVVPGRSIVVSAVVDHQWIDGVRRPVFGQKVILPGEMASVPSDEVALLSERGFIILPQADLEPADQPSKGAAA